MEYSRYGQFRFRDFLSAWVVSLFLVGLSVVSCILDLPVWYALFPLPYVILYLYKIVWPFTEFFSVNKNEITVRRFKKKSVLEIPERLTVIASLVDICPPFAVKTVHNTTHILKNKLAVTVLTEMPLDDLLERLHAGYIQRYTTNSIQNAFEPHRFVYSFVCGEEFLKEFLNGREYTAVIPESLLEALPSVSELSGVFVDVGY